MKRRRRKQKQNQKYSAVFLEYAAPLLEQADSYEDFCAVARLAEMGWNGPIIDEQRGTTFVDDCRARLSKEPDGESMVAVFEFLVERRLNEFGEERWTGEVSVRRDGEDAVVRVEARSLQ